MKNLTHNKIYIQDGEWEGEITCLENDVRCYVQEEINSEGIKFLKCEKCGQEVSEEIEDYPYSELADKEE